MGGLLRARITLTELRQEFVLEARICIARFERELAEITQYEASDKPLADRAHLDALFRSMHTLKASSQIVDCRHLGRLASCCEDFLQLARDHDLRVDGRWIDLLWMVADAARSLLIQLECSGDEGASQEDAQGLDELCELLRRGSQRLDLPWDDLSRDPNWGPQRLGDILVRTGEVSSWDVLRALSKQSAGDRRPLGTLLIEEGVLSPQALHRALDKQGEHQSQGGSRGTLRVDVDLLESAQSQLRRVCQALEELAAHPAAQDALQERHLEALRHATHASLALRRCSYAPLRHLFFALRRRVKSLSLSLAREAVLETEGDEIRIDPNLFLALQEILLHLITNSLCHGIETPEERRRHIKPASGTIRVRCAIREDHMHVDVEDDGRGIDLETLNQRAKEAGLGSSDDPGARLQGFDVVFLPGVSSAAEVDAHSGRGVGLDVVRSRIHSVGGTIQVESQSGRFTRFSLRIPCVEPR